MSEGTGRPLPDLFVVPDFDHARISVSFTAPRSCRSVEWQLLQDEAAIAAGSVRPEEPPALTSFEVEIPGFIPWTLSRPFLYVLRMNLIDQDGTVELRQPFGMRKFHVEGRQIYFNNRPLLVKGFIRGREAHDHPNLAGLPEEQYYAKNILTAKRYGFNLVRFHSRVPPDLYFDVADRLGLLVHIEMRRYYGKYQKQRELMDHDPQLVSEEDWRQMVLRLRNHPSLMVYCMGNEINAPGRNPQVKRIAELTRQLDPTRLFIDTCARGEYDRSDIDFDVQHMGYFCPFGRHYSMFDTADNWGIFGSVSGKKMVEADDEANPGGVTRRHITPRVPVIAHEVGHYTAYRDLDALAAKFAACGADKPWWIDELKKLIKAKGLEADYPRLLAASQRFQYIWWKQVLESVRKSPILCGFHFL
ncbi:MAG: glycoside hydrolase family 2 TIM barrel-domain containing protein, partial [Phycisphaerae bacterium]